MTLTIRLCCGARAYRELDAYVAAHPDACFGHSPEWRRAIWRCYRLPQLGLVAREMGAVVGALPWTVMLSPLVGPYLAVAPFASYGDLLADAPEVARELLRETQRLGRRLGLAYALLRSLHGAPRLDDLRGAQDDNRFITGLVDLTGGTQAVWRTRLHAKTRNQIRKARRLGVEVHPVRDWTTFDAVFRSGNRALGSPFHGPRFFELLRKQFGEQLGAWVATTREGRPAAAALSIRYRDVTHYVYGQNVRALRSSCANSLLLWHLTEQACTEGSKTLDLGRSELGTTAERFKRKWGPCSRPITETLLTIWRQHAPNLNPTNPSLGLVQRAWSRSPEGVTRRLGPLLMMGIA